MNAAQVLDHFERICDAPDAIPRLRRFILDLAVRGKLVEQDPNDEPASELLKRIQAEKGRLEKEGKIKREKPVEAVRTDAAAFGIPEIWRWVRLGALTELVTKGSSPKWQGIGYVSKDNGVLFITSENVGNYKLRKLDELKYVEKRFNEIEPRSMLRFGDILMNLVGASIGRTAIYDLCDEANINQAVAIIRLIQTTTNLNAVFLLHYLNSPLAIQLMFASQVVTAQPNISLTNVREFPVPVPPLAEQHRIVAKVDELMALCDRLEAAQAERESRRNKVTAASLYRLNNGADADEFREHARFYLHHLPRLTMRPEHIQELRQTILNLAVRGRFFGVGPGVSGDGNKVGDFVKFLNGYAFESKSFQKNGVRLCRNVNVSHGALNWRSDNTACVSESAAADFQRYNLSEGDIVLSLDRPLISTGLKVAKVKYEDLPCLLLQRVGKAELLSTKINLDYFMLWLQSAYFMTAIDPGRSKGVPHISTRQVESLAFTPPLLSEQNRIVAKVEKLLPLCDRLEAQVTTTETESRRLLEAVLNEALHPT